MIGCKCRAPSLGRSVVLESGPGPSDRAKRSVPIIGQFSEQSQRSGAERPGRAQRTQVRQEGPQPGFLVVDPASPGVACFTSVPRGSMSAKHGRSKSRHLSQYPGAHGPSAAS